MPRFLRRQPRTESQLYDQLLRQFENEARRMIADLTKELTSTFIGEAQRALQEQMGGSGPGAMGALGGEYQWLNNGRVAGILNSATNYLFHRTTTRRSTAETSRSTSADSQFRLSRAQSAAELNLTIARGDKNG